MTNNFGHMPTVGSDDYIAQYHQLESRVCEIERRLDEDESRQPSAEAVPPKKKVRFGRIKKFFSAVITPILEFIPRLLNATARLVKACRA